jgi:predicted oxidoreductase
VSLVDSAPRRIGSFERRSTPIAFGCWRFTDEDPHRAKSLIAAALDAGITLIDTADVYGLGPGGTGFGTSESILGGVLAGDPSLRDRMILATKGGITPPVPYDSSPSHLRSACEASLRRLHTDVIDLYFVHRPDVFTHPAAVAETLSDLRASGKIREVGLSNHTPAQHRALAAHLDFPVAATQPEFSALHLDPLRDGTFDYCMTAGVAPLAWSPLAGGALATGRGVRPELVAALDRIAAREETDRVSVALAFVLAHPANPIAIVGTQRPERVAAAMAACRVRLERADVYDIIEASDGTPLP